MKRGGIREDDGGESSKRPTWKNLLFEDLPVVPLAPPLEEASGVELDLLRPIRWGDGLLQGR